MPQFLTFALVAPMASFGAIAVGERRSGWDRPGRSAVLGIIGACLGIEREDGPAQAALAEGYGLALYCHAPGRLLADYHTAQVPSSERGRSHATRAQELDRPSHELNTILTRRDYRLGAWHLAALWPWDEARWSLETIAGAMREPVFVPFLGRKSCPLGLPLAPEVTEAEDAVSALIVRHGAGREREWRDAFSGRLDLPAPTIALDAKGAHGEAERVEWRRDQPRSRSRWQFDLREEVILRVPSP